VRPSQPEALLIVALPENAFSLAEELIQTA
jgi:hypothetical protein